MNRILKIAAFIFLFILCHPYFAEAQVVLPDNVDTSDCTVTPPATAFDIALKWQTPDYTDPDDPHTHGCSTPLVADLDGDGFPEVITAWLDGRVTGNTSLPSKYIVRDLLVWEGRTGAFKYRIKTCFYQIHGQSVAIGDANGDGKCEIYIVGIGAKSQPGVYQDKYVYCYDGSKANSNEYDYIWKSEDALEHIFIPMLADLNNDGLPELVCGGTIFNAATGTCLLQGIMESTGMGFGDPQNVHGQWNVNKSADYLGEGYYLFALADMDNDNQLEVCAGNKIYKPTITNAMGMSGNTWSVLRTGDVSALPYQDMTDGQTIVLDFDNDGDLDVCVLGRRTDQIPQGDFPNGRNHLGLYVWDGQTDELLGYHTCNPKTYSQSVPFAGDIDGDGYPEIIFNGWILGYHWLQNPQYTDMMHVFKFQEGWTSTEDNTKSWNIKRMFNRNQTKEFSESAGFTVFDFNQDGASEIVFRGTTSLYIMDGPTLEKLCDPFTAYSGTMAEYPIVADVDCDGHADIIVTEQYSSDNQQGRVSVYESKTPGAWGPARKIWNQWPYNVVNVNENGTIPKNQFDVSTQFPNGQKPFNAFLQQATMLNSNGDMFLSAPDAEAVFEDSVTFQNLCDEFVIELTYTNSGSLMLNSPYGISVYKDSLGNSPLRTVRKNEPLNPGDTAHVRIAFSRNELENLLPIDKFFVSVNDMGTGPGQNGGQQLECDLENNVLSHDFEGMRISEEAENPVIVCDGASYEIGEHVYTESGDYVDTLVNRFGCDSIVHTHLHLSAIEFDFATTRYCSEDLPVTLDASSSGATGYQWSTGDTTATIQAMVSDGGTDDIWEYYVIVYNSDGCLDTSNTVTIYRNPVVEITTEPDTSQFCTIGEATFTAAAVNINASEDVTWLWDNGETTTSIVLNTTHELTPWVEATFHECTGRDSIYVPECPCSVKFFNTLTPNGDGFNDTFAPVLEATFNYYKLVIYNRWGECVFKSKDPEEKWDGTINGQEASAGTYYYVFTYACMSAPDEKVSRHGSVTLVR